MCWRASIAASGKLEESKKALDMFNDSTANRMNSKKSGAAAQIRGARRD